MHHKPNFNIKKRIRSKYFQKAQISVDYLNMMIKIFALALRSHFQPEQLINAFEPQLKFHL